MIAAIMFVAAANIFGELKVKVFWILGEERKSKVFRFDVHGIGCLCVKKV